ncbi:MAG TPA: chromate efflux transporter [Gemmatimonadaceae bacterium]|nr:chromate efflux transporter [Gemmatimonadaceae bacterium]
MATSAHANVSRRDIAGVFLKLGTIAFGGPAAHIAMMEEEIVVRRKWLSRQAFLDYLGATNLIPGPNSTELAIHIGHVCGGPIGLLIAGACFILPAALIVMAIAYLYVRFGQLPIAASVLYALKPVVIAIVVQALVRLSRAAIKSRLLAATGIVAVVATALGANELVVLIGGGLVAAAAVRPARSAAPAPLFFTSAGIASTTTPSASLIAIFGLFAKTGAVLFGSGYVLLAFLRADFVDRLHWLTDRQLLDAIVVGQITPGPVFTTATFVGYVIAGWRGGVVATAGIFLPAFVFVAASGPLIPRLRRSPTAGAALDGVTVASLALMTVVTFQLGRAALPDVVTWVIAGLSLLLLLRYRVNSAWLVAGGLVAGLLAR